MSTALALVESAISEVMPTYKQSVIANSYSLVPEAQQFAAMGQLTKSKFIFDIASRNPESVRTSVIRAGNLGLDLTEGKRQGWLIPRKGKSVNEQGREVDTMGVVLQVGYKGVEAIHQRLGIIKRLSIACIHANDEFIWNGDDEEKPLLKADWNGNRGDIIGVYSVTYFPDGDIQVNQTPLDKIYKNHRDKSDSWKNENMRKYSPWMTAPQAMIEKTQAFIASKQWPALANNPKASPILTELFEADAEDHTFAKPEDVNYIAVSTCNQYMATNDSLALYLYASQIKAEYEADKTMTENQYSNTWKDELQAMDGFKGAIKARFKVMVDTGKQQIEDAVNAHIDGDMKSVNEFLDGRTSHAKELMKTVEADTLAMLMNQESEQEAA